MAQSKNLRHLGQENKWLSKTIKMWYQQGKYQKNEYFLETSRPLQKIKIIEMRVDLYTKTKIINMTLWKIQLKKYEFIKNIVKKIQFYEKYS